MKGKLIWSIFWALVAVFVIIIATIFALAMFFEDQSLGYNAFAAWPVFFGLGIVLLVLTVRKKVEGKFKAFLLLTGAAAVGMPVFAVMHNVISGLFNIEEAVFFTLATIVCPLGFLTGIVGTIVLAVRSRPTAHRTVAGGKP